MNLKEEIERIVKGEVFDDPETLKNYSRDASLFEVFPSLVVWPQDAEDIQNIVRFVAQNKGKNPDLSISVRAAGSCMSGGSLNDSIVLDVSKHINKFSVDSINHTAQVEPGVFYRDFEVETLKHNLILPCYTASKNLCALGGMIGNNAAGEKTLFYGKMENYIEELTVILSDGSLATFSPLSRVELLRKSHYRTFEGSIYDKMNYLLEKNRDDIQKAKPKVSKNSAGYYLWNVERNGLFDLTRLLVGSQGTLGIVVSAKLKLVEVKPKSKLLVLFMKETSNLGEVVNTILAHNPESLESYDDSTLKLAVRYFREILRLMKMQNILKLAWSFLPEMKMVLKGGLPHLVLLVEFAGRTDAEIDQSILDLEADLQKYKIEMHRTKTEEEAEKYWTVRRESFNLLRKHIKGKRTAPFIDDICVSPSDLPEFLPQLKKILNDSNIFYTIAGHAGNGNFHIIPLMDMKEPRNRSLIPVLSDKVYELVGKYKGSITAEHNDGIVRTPYLNTMFPRKILDLFRETKSIFDPNNILNPGKKVPTGEKGTVAYMVGHIVRN